MDITQDQIEEIEQLISKLENLDPTELPEPAAELVDMLNSLLDPDSSS